MMAKNKTAGVLTPRAPAGVIRGMSEQDLDTILAIEKRSFAAPWSRRMFEETLVSAISRGFVLEHGGAVLAYMVLYFVDVEAHILNIAVDPEKRGRGLAGQLLTHAVDLFKANDVAECYLEVREHNRDAQRLYRRFGFQTIGKRRRYYTETGEDALVMQLLL